MSPTERAIFKSIAFQQSQQTGKESNLFQYAGKDEIGTIRRGADLLDRKAFFNAAGLDKLPDARREMFRRALAGSGLGYDAATIDAYLNNLQTKDGVALNWRGSSVHDANNDGKASIDEINAYVKDLVAGKQIGEFTIRADVRLELAVTEARLKGDKKAEYKMVFENERLRAEQDFERNRTGSLLIDGLKALDMHNKLSRYGDNLKQQIFTGAEDYRSYKSDVEQMANRTADQIEKDVKESLNSNSLLSNLSEDAKNRIVDFYVGVERGTVRLSASIDGIGTAANDLLKDAYVLSMENAGYDMTAYKAQLGAERNSPERQAIAEYYRANSAMNTKRLQIEETVYQTKKDLNIRTTVVDLPSFSRSIGESVPQMLPQLAVGAATGGSSLATQIVVNAAVAGALAGGESYATTNGNRSVSTQSAIFGAINGAMIPLGNKLGMVEEVALNTGSAIITGKLQGQSDDEIINSMIQQAGGAAAFAVGGKLNSALARLRGKESLEPRQAARVLLEEFKARMELAGKEQFSKLQTLAAKTGAKVTIQNGKLQIEVPERLERAVQTARDNYGQNNRVMTRERIQIVDQALRPNDLQMNVLVIPPFIAKGAARAMFHGEGVVRAFADAVTEFRKTTPEAFSEAEFAAAYRVEAAIKGVTIDEAAMNAAALKREAPEGMSADLQQIRETITDGFAREAFDVRFIEASRHTKGVTQFEAMIAGKRKRGNLSEELKSDYQKDIANIVANDPAVKQARYDKAWAQIDQSQFINRKDVQKWINKNDVSKLREPISIEMTRQILEKQYPASRGYEIQEGVKLYEDSGFKTKADWEANWRAKHPGQPLPNNISVIEANGKAWQTVTDADIVVVKKNAAGKYEVIHVEQIKSGKDDIAGKAQKQLNTTMDGLRKIGANDQSVRIYDEREVNITSSYDLSNIGKAKAVTRGPDDRPHFNEKIGVDSRQIADLANKILMQERAKGGN